ncbi:MAG: TfoX/Sxy family protein [Nitrosopumilus sp.]|nr:TfoX/Sxy family protein [Nitrosopumilus sp.]
MKNYQSIKNKVEQLKDVTIRPMFGYQCYSISKKFFVGFSSKNDFQIIVRLPKEKQLSAIEHEAIKPFSHGAKMGWIEIDSTKISSSSMAMKWIVLAYENALNLSKKK